MENESLTHYMRVAVSLAERIAAGELREGEKLSGRSKLSPEYNVSPETVRRALRLLADMKVVEVKEQSGVYILSADNARRYLHLCAGRTDLQEKQRRLRRLLAQQEQLHRQVTELCTAILDETGRTPESLPNYSCRIPETWAGSGKTVGELQFWQQTGATGRPARRSAASSRKAREKRKGIEKKGAIPTWYTTNCTPSTSASSPRTSSPWSPSAW